MYFELSNDELINYINDVYLKIKKWNYYYEIKKYELIISEYKMIEPIISELELCLADLENIFHMNGISYSLFQIGKILSNIKKSMMKMEDNKSVIKVLTPNSEKYDAEIAIYTSDPKGPDDFELY